VPRAEMTSRERVLASLNHQEPDRVPIALGQATGDGITLGAYRKLLPVEVRAAGMGDTARLKREFGDTLAFWGAIDTHHVLPQGTVAEVREEVRRRISDLGPGGGYVVSPVHNIQPDVPPTNVVAMYDAAYELGRYPLRR